MRAMTLGAVVLGSALAVGACGSSGSGPTSTSASPTQSSSSASPTPSPTQTTPTPTPTSTFRFVGDGLERPGFQDVLAAEGLDQVVVGAVRTKSDATGVDVGLVFSTDAGETWAWGGTLKLPGEQVPRGIMVTPQGAVIVGETRSGEADPTAFIAAAAAPAFDLFAVQLPSEFAGPVSIRDIVLVKGKWVVVGLGRDESGFASLLWTSSDEGATWKLQTMALPEVMAPAKMVVGPDGAWNVVGATRKAAAWARSEDSGATWTYVQPAAFADGDNATQFVMNDKGVVAVLGSDGARSALWASNAQGRMARVPLPDPSVQAVLFQGDVLMAAGSPDNKAIQFWSLASGTWAKDVAIEGDKTGIYLDQVVSDGSSVVVMGNTWSTSDDRNIGIWKGTLIPVV